ncbi:MAG: hypothetical protein RLZZ606_84 [Actinomycetota bacterium]
MSILAKWQIKLLVSLLLSIGTLGVSAEVVYFLMEIASPTPNGYFLPISFIPGFYYMWFSIFANNWVLSIVSLALWFTGSTAYLFLRLSEKSSGLEYKFLKRKYVVLVTLLFALVNLVLGMFLAVIPILIFLPVFMYLPLPRIKPTAELAAVSP